MEELPASRQIVDYGNEYAKWHLSGLQAAWQTPLRVRPEPSFVHEYAPALAWRQSPMAGICSHFAHLCINKTRQPVYCVRFTPEGRRVLTGAGSGEFTLWHGSNFGFEYLMQAHDHEVRSLAYSHSGEWLLSGDRDGTLKVWQPNFNNVHILAAHRESVSGIAWSPTDAKFVTGSDDSTLKIWSFATMTEEATLSGHGWDVKAVDWHPTLGLVVSASKDNALKLWDPRQGSCLATIHGFKNTVTCTKFQKEGSQRLLVSGSKDNTARVFEMRMMQHVLALRGHESEVTALAWHPVHPELISTGTRDGAINHFLIDQTPLDANGLQPAVAVPKAHGWPVWDLAYHPAGHMLCSASNDKSIRFWTRPRPGDPEAYATRFFTEEAAPADYDRYQQRAADRRREIAASQKIPGVD